MGKILKSQAVAVAKEAIRDALNAQIDGFILGPALGVQSKMIHTGLPENAVPGQWATTDYATIEIDGRKTSGPIAVLADVAVTAAGW
ncbi:MAG: hypothetical protein NTV36_01680 [Candidatus Staskawiczbacteria bacterium]|nr:hypothetical protein [Candidatus Staskawiczbacteria bacterium]